MKRMHNVIILCRSQVGIGCQSIIHDSCPEWLWVKMVNILDIANK